MHQPPDLPAHGFDHPRVAVTEVGHRDPAEEIEVLAALGVPHPRSLSAHELDRETRVRADHARTLQLLQLLQGPVRVSILVPSAASVNSSSSSEWATRPSRMWAAPTPAPIASTQALSFGAIPPWTRARASSTCSVLACAIRLWGSSGSLNH